MNTKKFEIATAKIGSISKEPYWFEHRCFYAFDIIFSQTSTLLFQHLAFIPAGKTKEEAKMYFEGIVSTLRSNGFLNDNILEILFEKNSGRVRAMKVKGTDAWSDTYDNFEIKPFSRLSLSL